MLRYFTIAHVVFINKKLTRSECMVLLLLNFHLLAFFMRILLSFFCRKNTISLIICYMCAMIAVKAVRWSVTVTPQIFKCWTQRLCVIGQTWLTAQAESDCSLCVSGVPWKHASCMSSFWASCSQAPRICCDPRSSQLMPSWRAGAYGRFTVAWCCWCHSCSALTTCLCSAAACWSKRSSLSSSGRNSTTTQLK